MEPRQRVRELGISPGILPTGRWNAITDVAGVKVGHVTLIEGDDVRTGVTAILPHAGNIFQDKVPAGILVGNGFGKLIGSTQVEELGEIETPIVLTNTLSVPRAAEALIDWTLTQTGNEEVRSVNPVVGETNDGLLNNIRKMAVTKGACDRGNSKCRDWSRCGRLCWRGHWDSLLWLEGWHRHKFARSARDAWRIYGWRFGAIKFWRGSANGWDSRRQETWSILFER